MSKEEEKETGFKVVFNGEDSKWQDFYDKFKAYGDFKKWWFALEEKASDDEPEEKKQLRNRLRELVENAGKLVIRRSSALHRPLPGITQRIENVLNVMRGGISRRIVPGRMGITTETVETTRLSTLRRQCLLE